MRFKVALVLGTAACLALSGCGKNHGKPTGQVVATVDGQEITAIDLKTELGGFNTPDPKIRKAAEQQALGQIIQRRILAAAAEKQGVGKSPEFAQQKKRMEENLLVQAWQEQLVKSVPKPSQDEAEKFVAAHPTMYADRKIWEVEQVLMPRNPDKALIDQLAAVTTMPDLTRMLASRNVPYQTRTSSIDTLGLDPKLTEKIAGLPAGTVFLLPTSGALIANVIHGSKAAPLPQPDAVRNATEVLKRQRMQDVVGRQFQATVLKAVKTVQYNDAYAPPKPPAPAKPAAGAAPAAKPPTAG